MDRIENLLHELKLVSEVCPKGSRRAVAKAVGISDVYEYQIRAGKNATTNTPENRKLIRKMIDAYRQILREERRKIEKVL